MNARTATITPFTIDIPDQQLADLKERLTLTRWPAEVTDDWSRGQPVRFIKELCEQWLNRFDWRAAAARLNRLPQFTTEIDGQTIHFVHVRSGRAGAFPLVLTHGWPATFAEYADLIEPLTNPASGQAFDLVMPSLPGFGFSTPLAGPGWDSARTARAWDVLMQRLGYARYGFVGNDVGSFVGKEIGVLAPKGLAGVHVQQIFAFPGDAADWANMDAFEAAGMANADKWEAANGYQRIQQTRPATLAYGLVDSPAAQLAWNTELIFGTDGHAAETFDRERFLTDVSIYWFTGSGGSAANIYLEDFRSNGGSDDRRVDVPVAVAVFPDDFRSVRAFCEPNNNIVQWTQMPRGGHFAAITAPELLAADVQTFFAGLV
ncbi:MAG TPA: epoxide hydrolase [Devosia sp.]|nr:epoxide hydrolase [Devosia sp.]